MRTGNLLTGQMLIDLDIYPDVEPEEVYYEGEFAVLPTIPTTMDSLMLSVNEILLKLSELPLDEIGRNLNELLAGANEIANAQEIRDSLSNISRLSAELNTTVMGITEVVAGTNEIVQELGEVIESSEVKQILTNVESASARLDETLSAVNNTVAGFQQDSDAYQSMLRLMHELSAAARSLRQMADYLERHPDALLKGKVQ